MDWNFQVSKHLLHILGNSFIVFETGDNTEEKDSTSWIAFILEFDVCNILYNGII
jgi:hypothetical protein